MQWLLQSWVARRLLLPWKKRVTCVEDDEDTVAMTALEDVIGRQLTVKRKLIAAKSKFVIARSLREKRRKMSGAASKKKSKVAPAPKVLPAPVSADGPAPVSADGPAPKRVKRQKKEFVDAIGGGWVYFDKEYTAPAVGAARYSNWQFKCHHHKDCQRTMGLGKANTRELGDLEPLAYLHVWRDVPPNDKGHVKTHPTPEQVSKFYHDHLPELQTLADHFGAPKELR